VKQKTITNSLQTNGTLLTAEWCQFLKKNNFMVGISLDGPKEIHDRYRRDRKGNGTFDQVIRGLKLLQKHKVDYNVLACVARDTAKRPVDVYRFFKKEGVEFIQFTPVVERLCDVHGGPAGLRLAGPAALDRKDQQCEVTPWSVIPEEYGDSLIAIYEEWVRHDVGTVFVMNFEWVLNAWIGNPSPVCVHARTCGRSVVIEHNGDVFACDHCVYPEYKLGNILSDTLPMILQWDESFDIGSDTLTGVNDADYKPPFPLTAKLNKLTIKVDRPKLTEEDIKKIENAEAEALDGKPLRHGQPGPH
jgi:uncharacterized protein